MPNWNTYHAPNLGYLYYKRLYKDLEENNQPCYPVKPENDTPVLKYKKYDDEKKSPFTALFKEFYNYRLANFKIFKSHKFANVSEFDLYTIYPGLLLGSGYMHDSHTIGDTKLGFYFDHTTGLPVIPGSSVKGVIRSFFEPDFDKMKKKNYSGELSLEAWRFLINEFKEKNITHSLTQQVEKNYISNMVKTIFGNENKPGSVVFLDAHIDFEKSTSKTIMANDYITPHYPYLLKSPKPLMFVKILPNINFKFQFIIPHHIDETAIKKEDIKNIFLIIISTLGIGAKTNVGYGQFEIPPEKKFFEKDESVTGIIKEKIEAENKLMIEINGNSELKPVQVKANKFASYIIGAAISVIVNNINEDGSIKSLSLKN